MANADKGPVSLDPPFKVGGAKFYVRLTPCPHIRKQWADGAKQIIG